MLRAGRIVYTNDLPIYTAFDEDTVRFPGALVADVPSRLNHMLIGGQLDLSPISAFFYAQHAHELSLLPDVCIGSRRDVWSVVLVSPKPPEALDGATIWVTTESASGRNLLRVLLERRYGVHARFLETTDPLGAANRGEAVLLIGDRAIDARLKIAAERVYDLGSIWHAWTGMDMVYAVWAVRRDTLAADHEAVIGAMSALREAQNWGALHMDRVLTRAQATHPRPPGFYGAYFETLNFNFDAQARAGLRRFFTESHAIGAIATVPPVDPEVLVVHS
ncbi:MAG TPA: menaquinone biosynthesis protein [Candidatus Acidoferrales bacterium]|nr:menaquinone biosynthesis protein [Candidatus Acidoferrales bacterium]